MNQRPMRRAGQEITRPEELGKILAKGTVCRIAINSDDGYPYIVPLSYGYEYDQADGSLKLYFHCASQGRKLDLLRCDPKAGFEIDDGGEAVQTPDVCHWSMHYYSITGAGKITELCDIESKKRALDRIMQNHGRSHDLNYNEDSFSRVTVLCLTAEWFTGKSDIKN